MEKSTMREKAKNKRVVDKRIEARREKKSGLGKW